MFGKIAKIDKITGRRDAGGGDYIFEFADITGPGVLQKNCLTAARETGDIFSVGVVVFLQEELNEKRNIFQALRQGWDTNLDGTEAIEEIFAESPGKNFSAEIAIRCRDEPHVHLLDFRGADALNFAILKHAKQFGLQGERSFPNFIEKHGTAVGVLEKSRTRVGCTSKCTADVTEELAFEQCVDQGRAVANREALLRDRADLMDGSGDEFLAGTGRANQENVGVVARDFAGEVEDFEHGRAFANDAVKFEVFEKLFFERGHGDADRRERRRRLESV